MSNQHSSPWNPNTEQGKKNLEALTGVLRSLKRNKKHREDLKDASLRNPLLRNISHMAIKDKLRRADPTSEIGKLWADISKQPNILGRLFPDSTTHAQLAQDLESSRLTLRQLAQKYPQLKGLTKSQRTDLKELLGIKPNGVSSSDPKGDPGEETAEKKAISHVDAAIDKRVAALVADGVLLETDVAGLYQRIVSEFAADTTAANFTLPEEYFAKKLDRFVWTSGADGTLTVLKEFIEKGVDLEKFHEYYPHIPQAMILAKAQELRGLTNIKNPPPFATSFVAGIGRLFGDEDIPPQEITDFSLPDISSENPFPFPFVDARNFRMGIINGPQLGLLHTPFIEENTTRRAFAYAEQRQWETLILTGMFDLDMKKAEGPVRGVRALYSGRSTTIDVLDPGYQEDALRIINAIRADEFTSEIVYETAKEAVKNLLGGWWKVFHKPDLTPEFSEKVLIVLGPKEFESIMAAAHAEILYITIRKQGELRAERGAVRSITRQHVKRVKALEAELIECERALLQNQDRETQQALQAECEAIRQKITGFNGILEPLEQKSIDLERQEARIRMTNVRPEDWQRFSKLALGLISLLIQRAIPGSQVISLGTTYIKVGPEPKDKIKIVIPGHFRVTDGLVSEYAKSYAEEALSMQMAETVILCHPHAISYAMTAREVDAQGKRGYAPRIYAAPICVDGKFMRDKTGHILRAGHPIGKVISHPFFQGGILEITSTDGIVNVSPITTETLGYYEQTPRRERALAARIADKYIWVMAATDQHYGSRAKEFLWSPELAKSLGMAEAAFHLMRKAGYGDGGKLPPFHMFVVNDDPTQGHHFDASKEPHRHEMPYYLFEEEMGKLYAQLQQAKGRQARAEIAQKIQLFALRQVRVRGSDSYTRQMEDFARRHIKANIDMFSGMLLRSTGADLILKPVSDFEGYLEVPYDTCDLGLINHGTGNHGDKTTDGNFSEGPVFAELTRAYLLARPAWAGQDDVLDRLVKGPLFGKKFISFGTLQAPGGYEWAFDLRNTPASYGTDWGLTVRGGARTAIQRGNYARIFDKKFIIRISGDKHFVAMILASFFAEIMAPAGTHTDAYGELGFPPNNTGILFVGLPAEGPDAGPILLRPLLRHQLEDYITLNPREFPVEEYLPNAL